MRKSVKQYINYEVDTEGHVWSRSRNTSSAKTFGGWHELKYQLARTAIRVSLSKNNAPKWEGVHRLVAEAFIPNLDNKPMVCHRNGNFLDNRVENLYWGTAKENQNDRKKHGTVSEGEKNGMSKLNKFQVQRIKLMLAIGETQKIVSGIFKINSSNVNHIKAGRTWSHVVCSQS